MPLGWGTTFRELKVLSKMASCFQILDLEFLDTILKKILENIKYQKDAQRNSVQKELLNSSPSFFSASFVKRALIRITQLIFKDDVANICSVFKQGFSRGAASGGSDS